ncbi:YrhK family protein [Saccharopolyspora sp. NPDC000359]|uniref:YrhK family protein n=1 Tax=Saccharopolyspora sp. NPDC000359 TaxID=3154251 RepID=UPI0033229C6A
MSDPAESNQWVLRIGHEELVVRQRYEVLSIGNDFLIALWFIIGSLLFFQESTATAGTWLFLLGSCELAVRPAIRLTRYVHLRRLRPPGLRGCDQDF